MKNAFLLPPIVRIWSTEKREVYRGVYNETNERKIETFQFQKKLQQLNNNGGSASSWFHLHTSSLQQRHSLQENAWNSFNPFNKNTLREFDRMCERDRTITELVVIKGLCNALHKLHHHQESGLWNKINKLRQKPVNVKH